MFARRAPCHRAHLPPRSKHPLSSSADRQSNTRPLAYSCVLRNTSGCRLPLEPHIGRASRTFRRTDNPRMPPVRNILRLYSIPMHIVRTRCSALRRSRGKSRMHHNSACLCTSQHLACFSGSHTCPAVHSFDTEDRRRSCNNGHPHSVDSHKLLRLSTRHHHEGRCWHWQQLLLEGAHSPRCRQRHRRGLLGLWAHRRSQLQPQRRGPRLRRAPCAQRQEWSRCWSIAIRFPSRDGRAAASRRLAAHSCKRQRPRGGLQHGWCGVGRSCLADATAVDASRPAGHGAWRAPLSPSTSVRCRPRAHAAVRTG